MFIQNSSTILYLNHTFFTFTKNQECIRIGMQNIKKNCAFKIILLKKNLITI